MLNLISLLGLFIMIAIAWLMSSYRSRVNWRLVVMGLGLQFVLAAIFFNSQSWTFPRQYSDWDEVIRLHKDGTITSDQVDTAIESAGELKIGEQIYSNSAELLAAIENGQLSSTELQAKDGEKVYVARFPKGVVFYLVDQFFGVIKKSVDQGAGFVFTAHPTEGENDPATNAKTLLFTFAFGVLPTVIFFASLMSVLYYIGLMQQLIRAMAWLMQKTLGTSGVESLAAAANVFVGHTEAPLVVKPYVATMTRSELNALMVGGFATISGSLMAIFANLGVSAGHLLTASIISAPAALLIAKILQPETETPVSVDEIEAKMERNATNIIEAAANGASEGMKLAINIAAMLIAFLALIALIDFILIGVGSLIGFDLSLSIIFGWIFRPLAWIMGIETGDCAVAGELLGKKMVINEFVAYLDMNAVVNGAREGVTLSERTQVILIYALCGFSNFGAIGIQLGGIGPLAPNRKSDIAQLGIRAMLGGMIACCMTACIAGIFYGIFN